MSQATGAGILALAICGLLALVPAAMAETVTFAAGNGQISSLGVLDTAENLHGTLYFGTDNGLSWYDGTWHILHRTFGDSRQGLLSDHVLAVEFDGDGNLWMGFPNGLQRLEGGAFDPVQDQQLLKSLDIHGLLRNGRDMWVSAGNAGLHRFRDGSWTWYQPGGAGGLGCNYVTFMATDPSTGTLYAACREGIYAADSTGDPPTFSPLAVPGLVTGSVIGMHGDPFGGIYLLNSTAIFHLGPAGDWKVITSPDLLQGIELSDLAVGPDRMLWVATNNGIYGWRDGGVRRHFDTNDRLGSNAVKKLYLDGAGRLWFTTPETVGYVVLPQETSAGRPIIPVTTYELPVVTTTAGTTAAPVFTPGISVSVTPEQTASPPGPLPGLLQGIQGFLKRLFGGGKS